MPKVEMTFHCLCASQARHNTVENLNGVLHQTTCCENYKPHLAVQNGTSLHSTESVNNGIGGVLHPPAYGEMVHNRVPLR